MINESQGIDLQKQKEECEKVAKETFNKVLAAYRLVIDGISDDSFEEVNKIFGEEMHKSLEGAGNAFKEYLFDLIKRKFTKIWIERDLDLSVAMLELAKRNYVTKKKWRPTGKSVEEQLRPHLGIILKKHREFLRQQVEDQKAKIDILIPQVEEVRKMLKMRAQKLSQISSQAEKDEQRMENAAPKIDEMLDNLI